MSSSSASLKILTQSSELVGCCGKKESERSYLNFNTVMFIFDEDDVHISKSSHIYYFASQENIANFGGDPNCVTLLGQGTGAALTSLLLLSPITQVRDSGLGLIFS